MYFFLRAIFLSSSGVSTGVLTDSLFISDTDWTGALNDVDCLFSVTLCIDRRGVAAKSNIGLIGPLYWYPGADDDVESNTCDCCRGSCEFDEFNSADDDDDVESNTCDCCCGSCEFDELNSADDDDDVELNKEGMGDCVI